MQTSKYLLKSPKYPKLLREIASPPKQLYVLGKLTDAPCVAIVGTLRPTEYGLRVTYKLAGDLARAGITVVSGLALGIDTIAHQAAIEAGGHTVAVLGSGLGTIYPTTNRTLALKLLKSGGAILTEYEADVSPRKFTFPARNRIIAGLSLATIIPEADAASGSLITANFALNENRLVMAVPGSIESPRSAGPNNLIKSGAKAITDASDILAELNLESATTKPVPISAKSKEEALILELLNQGICSSQELIESSGLTPQTFAAMISLMEITGKIRNLGASTWVVR